MSQESDIEVPATDAEPNEIFNYLKHLDNCASRRARNFGSRDLGMAKFRDRAQRADQDANTSERGVRQENRCRISGSATMIDNNHLIAARIENISKTGVYLSCDSAPFKAWDLIRLRLLPEGHDDSYKSEAEVIRIDKLDEGRIGYGLRFKAHP